VTGSTAEARPAGARGPQTAYLDHASTTPLCAEAVAAMLPYLTDQFANPSGSHSLARAAWRALDDARGSLAAELGAEPGEVVFTSGGTEADNLAVFGLAAGPGTVVCSAIEHPAVLESCRVAGGTVVPVDRSGVIDVDALRESLTMRVRLVSVMAVNNETGALQPLEAVALAVRELAPDALVHTDAVQAVAWLDPAGISAPADLVTVSAHKFGGPKGIGALIARGPALGRLRPLLHGGPQEREHRAGTQNVAGAVAMAAAARSCGRTRDAATERVGALADDLMAGLFHAVPGVTEAVPRNGRVGAICNVAIEGIEAEELLVVLDELGVYASAGSACASGALEPSHVLVAMGRSVAEARRHVRFSLGHTTTEAEIAYALVSVPKAVERLRD
jgi:cysteine desulfurase